MSVDLWNYFSVAVVVVGDSKQLFPSFTAKNPIDKDSISTFVYPVAVSSNHTVSDELGIYFSFLFFDFQNEDLEK